MSCEAIGSTELIPYNERYGILGDLPIESRTVPAICTKENLFNILKSLPNIKSPGRSRIPYEAYKYAEEQFQKAHL